MNNLKFEHYLQQGAKPCNLIHAMDAQNAVLALKLGQNVAEALDKHAVGFIVEHVEPTLCPFGTELIARCAEVDNLPIDRLGELQDLLVNLMVFIVDNETECGELTSKAGNEALESMGYWNSLDVYTKEAGFKRLGNGHFSIAYSHPKLPGKVIKVGLKKEDSGAAYVAFCRMHQGRAGIPTIHSVARHRSCYTVVLDELASGRCIRRTAEGSDAYNAVCVAVEAGSPEDWLDDDSMLSEYNRELVETGIMIHKFFKGIARFDMHTGNIMLNKRGRIVITDPVSFSHDDREFSVDPEDLIAEVEAIAMAAMIERCRARKAKRSMSSIKARKAAQRRMKAAQRRMKAAQRRMAAAGRRMEACRAQDKKEQAKLEALWVGNKRAQEIAGLCQWIHINHRNSQADLIIIKNHLVAKEHYEIQKALVVGQALPMDARLDARFFKG